MLEFEANLRRQALLAIDHRALLQCKVLGEHPIPAQRLWAAHCVTEPLCSRWHRGRTMGRHAGLGLNEVCLPKSISGHQVNRPLPNF